MAVTWRSSGRSGRLRGQGKPGRPTSHRARPAGTGPLGRAAMSWACLVAVHTRPARPAGQESASPYRRACPSATPVDTTDRASLSYSHTSAAGQRAPAGVPQPARSAWTACATRGGSSAAVLAVFAVIGFPARFPGSAGSYPGGRGREAETSRGSCGRGCGRSGLPAGMAGVDHGARASRPPGVHGPSGQIGGRVFRSPASAGCGPVVIGFTGPGRRARLLAGRTIRRPGCGVPGAPGCRAPAGRR